MLDGSGYRECFLQKAGDRGAALEGVLQALLIGPHCLCSRGAEWAPSGLTDLPRSQAWEHGRAQGREAGTAWACGGITEECICTLHGAHNWVQA